MNVYQTYADYVSQIKALEKQAEALRPRLMGYVTRAGGKVENEFGRFQAIDSPLYEYSTMVQKREQELAQLKLLERTSGVAKRTNRPVLRYSK